MIGQNVKMLLKMANGQLLFQALMVQAVFLTLYTYALCIFKIQVKPVSECNVSSSPVWKV